MTLSVDSVNERGLLGIAFDPSFNSNHYVYLYYTVPGSPSHNRISRFTAERDVAAPGSEVVLLDLPPLSTTATNHNGGAMHFGRDGKLYVAVGDNNRSGPTGSQQLDGLFGKMLRLNKDGTIPTDNPFYTQNTGDNRAVWAWACATRSRSRCSPERAGSSSTTWASTNGRRSTTASRVRTTAGRSPRA